MLPCRTNRKTLRIKTNNKRILRIKTCCMQNISPNVFQWLLRGSSSKLKNVKNL